MKTRFVTTFLALMITIAMVMPSVTFASENAEHSTGETIKMVSIEESELSLQEALDILGLTEADVEGQDIYVLSSNVASPMSTQSRCFPTSTSYRFPTFTFSNSNRGQDWSVARDVKYFRWGVAVNATDHGVVVDLMRNGVYVDHTYLKNTGDTFVSDPIYTKDYGYDYWFYYNTGTSISSATVTMVIVTNYE